MKQPIDEAGRPTAKFHAIREVMARHLPPGRSLPPIPPPQPVVALPKIVFREVAPLQGNLPEPIRAQRPKPMEGCALKPLAPTPRTVTAPVPS